MTWWKIFKRGPRVVIPVSEPLLDLYHHMARRSGVPLDEWARRALNAAVPRVELRRLTEGTIRAAGLEAAFKQLDIQDATEYLAPPPVAKTKPPSLPVYGHPCSHLRAEYSSGFSARDSQGSCAAPSQVGRMCQWSATVADRCPLFEPYTRKKARR